MSSIRYLGIGLVALVFLAGCQSTSTVTRSGDYQPGTCRRDERRTPII